MQCFVTEKYMKTSFIVAVHILTSYLSLAQATLERVSLLIFNLLFHKNNTGTKRI